MATTSWSSLTTRQKVVVAAIGLSAGVAGLYICYTRYRNRRAPSRASPVKMKTIERQMKIPQEALKVIVGRHGNIRQRLQKQTDAYIAVSEQVDLEGEYNVTITGSHAQVRQAQEALNRLLQESVILRVGLLLPARCMSRIIGKDGFKIQSIIRSSGAKICFGPKSEDSAVQASNVTIIGTKEQVDKAKLLIQKILEEEENLQQRESKSSAFRYHRKEIIAVKKDGQKQRGDQAVAQFGERLTQNGRDEAGTSRSHEDTAYSSGSSTDNSSNLSKFEVPSPDFNFQVGEYVDVFVSALENPQHFWIQIQGSRLSQLDKLIEEMRDYYSNQTKSTAEIQVGDIVAAPFRNHSNWYRAEVLGFMDNGDVDLYYVDYGDNWATAMDDLFPLRSDFLSLPFQAIECCLAGISPAGGHWPEEAVDRFEELTHSTEWKPLLANICSFPSLGLSKCFEVQLYDPSFDQILDIGQQLISQGFAIEQKESPLQGENNLSQLLDEVINPRSLSVSSQQGEHCMASEKEKANAGLEERISTIKISCNETSPCVQKAETTPSPVHDIRNPIEPFDQNYFNAQPSGIDISLSEAGLPERPPSVPEAGLPERPPSVPEAGLPERPPSVPEAGLPERPPSVPEAGLPERPPSVPEAGLPERPPSVPEAGLPERPPSVPEAGLPERPPSVPEAGLPERPPSVPEAGLPERPPSVPEAGLPERPPSVPEAGLPERPPSVPEAGLPERPPSVPEAGLPERPPSVPEAGLPERPPSVPEAGLPERPPSVPEAGLPERPPSVPEAGLPERPPSVPEAGLPERPPSVPEAGLPERPPSVPEAVFDSTSSLDNSSPCSPRGYFYYVPDEMSTCSMLSSSTCDVITISSDSEDEADRKPNKWKFEKASEVLKSSGSEDDVILL